MCKHLRVRQHATQLFMESWNPLLWNPGIIEIGFHNHPPDRRRFEFEILELKNLKNSNIGARACLPKILTSLCTLLSHKFGIVHTSTRFRQATMGFSLCLATKPYTNSLVLISIVFITSLCRFWSVLSSFQTLRLSRAAIVPIHRWRRTSPVSSCQDAAYSGCLVHLHRRPLLTSN
mgnify:CR=1 FL=1